MDNVRASRLAKRARVDSSGADYGPVLRERAGPGSGSGDAGFLRLIQTGICESPWQVTLQASRLAPSNDPPRTPDDGYRTQLSGTSRCLVATIATYSSGLPDTEIRCV